MQNLTDETDAKILRMLLKEARTTFTEIAKNLEISVSTARARYKRLLKLGVITGEIMQINPYSLGYNCVCNIGVITALKNESKVKEFLRTRLYRPSVIGALGKYNVCALVALHNIQELGEIQGELEANSLIKHVEPTIWAEIVNMDHQENLVINPLTGKNEQKATQMPTITNHEARMDETDRQIAKILTQNSRTPFRKIARQLKISTKNVIQRYRRLKGTILTLSTITVDLNKLGYKAQADLFIKASNKSRIPMIHAQLLKTPNLIVLVKLIGPYDLFATVVLTDFREFFKTKDNIRRIQGIENLDIFLSPTFHSWPWTHFTVLL